MAQVGVIHRVQVIGEAARGVSQALRERHPEVPWPEIIALRNILVHEYFGLNMQQVWTMTPKRSFPYWKSRFGAAIRRSPPTLVDDEEATLNETAVPDWDAIEREVIRKLRYLCAAWEHTATNEPELHELMKRDLYLPTIRHLGAFCVAVKEE
ncbi:MAG: DUF86 domain-containing protein [Acidobacteria bacterium]|nr:DUF86 domain-containing protein [Acidobacteriota bacterium]